MLKGHEYHFIAWKPLTVGTECDIVFLGILNTCIGRSPKTKHIFWAQQFMGISLITTHCIYIWEIGALIFLWGLLRWLSGKESTCQWRRWGFDPWVGKIPWKRIWQPTPVFLPGQSHGQGRLAGCSPRGHKESDMTKLLSTHSTSYE